MQSETATASIDVAPVNDAPVITIEQMADGYGAGFDIKLEANVSDVDLNDRHVYGIQWSAGAAIRTGTALAPGEVPVEGAPTFIQSADGTAVLVDTEKYFGYGEPTITVCVSDSPGVTSLDSCTDADVTAVATRTLTIEPRVSKVVAIQDNVPKSEVELGMEVPEPIVDGDTFNVVFTVHNVEPEDVGTVLDATGVRFSARLTDGLVVGPAGLLAVTGDATNAGCSVGEQTLDCTADLIPAGGRVTA